MEFNPNSSSSSSDDSAAGFGVSPFGFGPRLAHVLTLFGPRCRFVDLESNGSPVGSFRCRFVGGSNRVELDIGESESRRGAGATVSSSGGESDS